MVGVTYTTETGKGYRTVFFFFFFLELVVKYVPAHPVRLMLGLGVFLITLCTFLLHPQPLLCLSLWG